MFPEEQRVHNLPEMHMSEELVPNMLLWVEEYEWSNKNESERTLRLLVKSGWLVLVKTWYDRRNVPWLVSNFYL